jgi:hypothetical protein
MVDTEPKKCSGYKIPMNDVRNNIGCYVDTVGMASKV